METKTNKQNTDPCNLYEWALCVCVYNAADYLFERAHWVKWKQVVFVVDSKVVVAYWTPAKDSVSSLGVSSNAHTHTHTLKRHFLSHTHLTAKCVAVDLMN